MELRCRSLTFQNKLCRLQECVNGAEHLLTPSMQHTAVHPQGSPKRQDLWMEQPYPCRNSSNSGQELFHTAATRGQAVKTFQAKPAALQKPS